MAEATDNARADKAEPTDLPGKYRPDYFDDVIGQEDAIRVLKSKLKDATLPHALMFTGPPGTGKTTLARILGYELGVKNRNDFRELNAALNRGIDDIRDLSPTLNASGLFGGARVFLFDECHRLSADAQDSLLKAVEEPPRHVYFIFNTTLPSKVHKTIRDRCLQIPLKPVKYDAMLKFVEHVVAKEKAKHVSKRVIEKVAMAADGSPRRALKELERVIGLTSEQEMLDTVVKEDVETAAFDLVKAFMPFKGAPAPWSAVADILTRIEGEDAEGLRHLVLACARKTLLDPRRAEQHPRAFAIINAFRDNFWDSKHAGLAAACYELYLPRGR